MKERNPPAPETFRFLSAGLRFRWLFMELIPELYLHAGIRRLRYPGGSQSLGACTYCVKRYGLWKGDCLNAREDISSSPARAYLHFLYFFPPSSLCTFPGFQRRAVLFEWWLWFFQCPHWLRLRGRYNRGKRTADCWLHATGTDRSRKSCCFHIRQLWNLWN